MQNSSEFQYIAIDTIHESATNPRRTFDECKLGELAESIRTNGLIQPITVRPNSQGFEIVAGARRFRAAQLAELFSLPARIVDINDAQALEWQLVENSQRVDVHPYEEAQGFQRLLDMPGYDVATLVEKSGKSAAHVYARLSLLQLVPSIAEAFSAERITASHANLLARLPQEAQATAYEQCWRKDWQDKEPHLLPAKHLSAWIQTNLYLSLAEAPFDKDDPTLNPPAGACVTCPRRSGFNTSLFADVQGDQCLDAPCFHTKVNAHIDREVAARPELVQIENAYRAPKEQRPGAVRSGTYREIDTTHQNPDAEPVAVCESAKPAIIVYGKRVGTTLTVCTDNDCPIHDPRGAAKAAEHPAPVMPPAPPAETEEEAEARKQQHEEQRKAHEAEQERRAEEFKQQQERQEQEYEAAQAERDEQRKARQATFERIIAAAPASFTASQLRVVLRAIVNLDPYTFADDLAEDIAAENENEQRSAEELLLATIDATADEKLTSTYAPPEKAATRCWTISPPLSFPALQPKATHPPPWSRQAPAASRLGLDTRNRSPKSWAPSPRKLLPSSSAQIAAPPTGAGSVVPQASPTVSRSTATRAASTRSPIFAVLPEQSSPKLTPSVSDCSRSSKQQKLNTPLCVSASQPAPSAGTPRPSRSHASVRRRTTMDGQQPQIWPSASPPSLKAGPSPTSPPSSAANTFPATPAAPAKPPTFAAHFPKPLVGQLEKTRGRIPFEFSPSPLSALLTRSIQSAC